jgi:hypothetical protein
MKIRLFVLGCLAALTLSLVAASRTLVAEQCVDFSNDPAGCQPSTFDTPFGAMPSVRIGRNGNLDPKSSEADARVGAALLEKSLHLFRNMEHLHWVITVPGKRPGDRELEGRRFDAPKATAAASASQAVIFVGHENGPGKRHAINIFRFSRIR